MGFVTSGLVGGYELSRIKFVAIIEVDKAAAKTTRLNHWEPIGLRVFPNYLSGAFPKCDYPYRRGAIPHLRDIWTDINKGT